MGAYMHIPFQQSPVAIGGMEESDLDGRWLTTHLDNALSPLAEGQLQTYAWTGHLENTCPGNLVKQVQPFDHHLYCMPSGIFGTLPYHRQVSLHRVLPTPTMTYF